MLKDLVLKNRSYRRFDESFEISKNDLIDLVELARLTPSSVNWQPLRFALVNDKETNAKIFENQMPPVLLASHPVHWTAAVPEPRSR
jgi:nitroreductase